MSTTTLAPRPESFRPAPRPLGESGDLDRGGAPVYRLTRRGRLVVLMLGLAVAFAAGVFFAAGSMASSDEPSPAPSATVLVQPGDTLWSIASNAADAVGDGDVRDMMTQIEALNDLDSSLVGAGQRLLVPTE